MPSNGRVFVSTAEPRVAVACLGVGAPAVVTLLEQLVALGMRHFVAVGPAPAVSRELRWGDCVVVDRALRDDGVSSHYLAPARYACADRALTARLVAASQARGLAPRCGAAWTVPTPFRTTEEELSAYRGEGVLVTDIVSAALFAVSTALGARAASAIMATTPVEARRAGSPAHEPPTRPPDRITAVLDAALGALRAEASAA